MIKLFSLTILTFLALGNATAQSLSLDEIRHEFYKTTLDYKHAFPLIDKLNNIKNPTPLQLAYKAATEAILAKPGWNIFKKMRHIKSSRNYFRMAIDQDMTDLEIRFLRLAVEYHIPKYLGYSKNIAGDKSVIMKNIDRFKLKKLPDEITNYIITFSIESGIYSQEEIDHLKLVMDS